MYDGIKDNYQKHHFYKQNLLKTDVHSFKDLLNLIHFWQDGCRTHDHGDYQRWARVNDVAKRDIVLTIKSFVSR